MAGYTLLPFLCAMLLLSGSISVLSLGTLSFFKSEKILRIADPPLLRSREDSSLCTTEDVSQTSICVSDSQTQGAILPVWSDFLQYQVPCWGKRTKVIKKHSPFQGDMSCALESLHVHEPLLFRDNLSLSTLFHRTSNTGLLVSLGELSIHTLSSEGPLILLAAGDINIQHLANKAPLICISAHGKVAITEHNGEQVSIQDSEQHDLRRQGSSFSIRRFTSLPLSYELRHSVP